MGSASKVKIYGASGNMIFAQKVRGNGGYFQFDAPLNIGGGLQGMFAPRGNFWFCDFNSGSDGNDGTSWAKAFKTLTKAVANAKRYDTIVMAAGVYVEGATVTVTENNLKILGVMSSGHQWGQPSLHTHGTETLLAVDSPDIGPEIAYIGFHDQGAGVSLEVARTVNSWRTHIHDCFFGGNSTALWAAVLGNTTGSGVGHGATVDAPLTILEDCHFYMYVTGNIFHNCAGVVERNLIAVSAAAEGIRYFTDSTSRPYGYIQDNKIHTIDVVNAKGVVVTNTPSPGYLMIDGNHFVNFATATAACDVVTSGKSGLMGLNYHNATAMAVV